MFDLGTQELIVIFIVAFLVFGPKKLPELGRTLGKGIRELKTAMRSVTETIEKAGEDVTDEIKATKDNLEESVFKSIESDISKKPPAVSGADEDKKKPMTGEEQKKADAESDRDR